ncbi:spore coat associated protein CotJA [Risungbinella massiliensis]|uniref:spore coat associated protein CotJA n=1 Tax=Risungbinella massiliensis TaxID=1329796 RepID=UPI0005CC0F8A|nr:spore coat associated protein CotJA [Risungbinella massiliensis]
MADQRKRKFTCTKTYRPFHSRYDPCKPIGKKYYSTPPNLYIGFQPPNLPQFSPQEALMKGTLWPAFCDYYENPYKEKERDKG